MEFKAFREKFQVSSQEIALDVFRENRADLSVKKEKTAVANLEKILEAVFRITYKKGFQAMSMRDLSRATHMSLGSLYAYFPGKEQLLAIIQKQGWRIIQQDLNRAAQGLDHPWDRLCAVIKGHLFLSEMYRPWFYFTFMETRNIHPAGRDAVKSMEDYTQRILEEILEQGERQQIFKPGDHALTAGMIKSMQQEWYLKRWKYKKMNVTVDRFAEHLMAMVAAFCLAQPQESAAGTRF